MDAHIEQSLRDVVNEFDDSANRFRIFESGELMIIELLDYERVTAIDGEVTADDGEPVDLPPQIKVCKSGEKAKVRISKWSNPQEADVNDTIAIKQLVRDALDEVMKVWSRQ